jgi:hypothetical protein
MARSLNPHSRGFVKVSSLRARCAAFYLPQFHPIPENDKAWGEGFTEWTNVRKAKPLFKGHEQPVIPGELGYYDLRDAEVREKQAELAKANGIEGFIYWHYWFDGKRLLERPFNEVLESGKPDFPFCLAWANESWTGFWHGNPDHMIMEQTYSGREGDIRHFNWLLPAFKDPRYMKVDGKPIFMVYVPFALPDAAGMIKLWNELAQENGLPGIYFVALKSGKKVENRKAPEFDASSTLRPSLRDMPLPALIANRLKLRLAKYGLFKGPRKEPVKHDYRIAVAKGAELGTWGGESFPCVFSNWDNTPRTGVNGHVYLNWTPELFEAQLENAVKAVEDRDFDHRLVLLRSWNEWAEGQMLEPDAKNGDVVLKTIRKVVVR